MKSIETLEERVEDLEFDYAESERARHWLSKRLASTVESMRKLQAQHLMLRAMLQLHLHAIDSWPHRIVAARAMERCVHLRLARSFSHWHSAGQRKRVLRQLSQRIVRRMLHVQLASLFDAFCSRVSKRRREREVCTRVVLRMQRKVLVQAWDMFRGTVQQMMSRRRLIKKMGRWRNPHLQLYFEQWLDHVDRCRLEATKKEKHYLVEALRNAQDVSEQEERRELQATTEKTRRIEMCKRAVKKMLRHQLSMAWNEFVDCVLTTKENREKVRRVLARMQHRQLAGAFDCFAGAVETIVAQRDQIAKSVVKWRAPGVKRAVDRWLEYMDMMAQERAEQAQELARQELHDAARAKQTEAEAEAERRIEMCKRVVKKMLRHQLSMAWNEFVDCVLTTKENRETVRRVLARMQHRQLAGAFDCFSVGVSTTVRQRELCLRALNRLLRQLLATAWNSLLAFTDATKRNRATFSRVIGRMQYLTLARAWDTFSATVLQIKANQDLVQRVLARWRTPRLLVIFSAWTQLLDAEKSRAKSESSCRLYLCKKTIERMLRPVLQHSFYHWCEYQETVRQRFLAEKEQAHRQLREISTLGWSQAASAEMEKWLSREAAVAESSASIRVQNAQGSLAMLRVAEKMAETENDVPASCYAGEAAYTKHIRSALHFNAVDIAIHRDLHTQSCKQQDV